MYSVEWNTKGQERQVVSGFESPDAARRKMLEVLHKFLIASPHEGRERCVMMSGVSEVTIYNSAGRFGDIIFQAKITEQAPQLPHVPDDAFIVMLTGNHNQPPYRVHMFATWKDAIDKIFPPNRQPLHNKALTNAIYTVWGFNDKSSYKSGDYEFEVHLMLTTNPGLRVTFSKGIEYRLFVVTQGGASDD